jgi:hypothetical protein
MLVRPLDCMRGLNGALQRQAANIGSKFREVGLIELVAATIQNLHRGMGEGASKALQMLDRDLGVVPAVIQTDRRQVTEADPKVGWKRKLREFRSPKWRGDKKQARQRRAAYGLRKILENHRSSEGVTHENRPARTPYQFVNPASPTPIAWVLRQGHAWGQNAIPSPQSIPE